MIGGDTIALPPGSLRVLGLTAIGNAGDKVPSRSGGEPGDRLWLVGIIGEAAAGLEQLRDNARASGPLIDVYRRPVPLLAAGRALGPHAKAMMDISDGLLLDARRLAQASGCGAEIDLDALPLTDAFVRARGADLEARLFAATGGDDYALLAALGPGLDPSTLSLPSGTTMAPVGFLTAGAPDIRLTSGGRAIALPERLGHEHRSIDAPPMAGRA